MLRFLPLALLLASASVYAQVPSDADQLAEQVRRLGSSPQDLEALLTAGEISVRMEDFSAAGAFFARAEKVDARNARAKAGEAALLVHAERPAESLRLFAQAEALGLAPARFAGERGLAYDLLGDPGRAQRDYQAALAVSDDAEVRRRYALSLAIAGRQGPALAELDPLIRQNDRAAWRSRAFVLAMGGDTTGATRIAETMMPPGTATALQGFFTQLPRLAPVDKAFAVHFGEVQATPQRLADARLPHEAPLPLAPVVAVQVPAAAVATDKRSRRDRKRRNDTQLAAVALPPPPPTPPPPAYQAPAYTPPAAATPMRDPSLGASDQSAVGGRAQSSRSRRGQGYAAPVVTRPLTAEEQRSLAAVSGSRDGTTSHRPDDLRATSVQVAAVTPPPPVVRASPAASSLPPVVTSPSPAATSVPSVVTAPSGVSATPAAAIPAPVATRALTPAEQASLVAAAGPPPRPASVAPSVAAPPQPGFTAAAVEVPSTGARPDPTIPAVPPRPRTSRRQQYAQTDSVLARIVAGLSVPASELAVPAPPTAAERRAAERKAAADKKAAAEKKAAAQAKAEADRQAAEDRRAARADPARIWVQVGGGANEAALGLSWRTIRAKAPDAFAGRQGWTTPLRATNRILAGPFKSDAEARAFVNKLAKAGLSAFTFNSEAGQKVTRLSTQ